VESLQEALRASRHEVCQLRGADMRVSRFHTICKFYMLLLFKASYQLCCSACCSYVYLNCFISNLLMTFFLINSENEPLSNISIYCCYFCFTSEFLSRAVLLYAIRGSTAPWPPVFLSGYRRLLMTQLPSIWVIFRTGPVDNLCVVTLSRMIGVARYVW